MKKYYCNKNIIRDDQWKYLVGLVLRDTDTIEFNILSRRYKSFLHSTLSGMFYEVIEKREGKIYQTGEFLRFPFTDGIKQFILHKDYADWRNHFIEDVCFISNGIEVLSTVTHENYIIMLLSEHQRHELNNNGFEFEIEWVS